MDKVASSGNDEFYTPVYAIEPLIKYLKPGSTIWCPFDTEISIHAARVGCDITAKVVEVVVIMESKYQ